MHRPSLVLTLLLLALIPFGLSAQDFRAGQTTEVDWAGCADKMKVYLPTNYDPAESWPVYFNYHGTNGRPALWPTQEWTENRDWIIVGMPYRIEGLFTISDAAYVARYAAAEVNLLHRMRTKLAEHVNINQKRIYIGGVSKGGWVTSIMAATDPDRIAGAMILMGGYPRLSPSPRASAKWKGKPIFIGVGTEDPNYLFSRYAESVYEHTGARVCFDSWTDLGHKMPKDSVIGRHWLRLQSGRDAEGLRGEIAKWATQHLDEIAALPSAAAQAEALMLMSEDPWADHLPAEARERRTALGATLRQNPAVREAMAGTMAFKDLLRREIKVKTLAEMQAVLAGYRRVQRSGILPGFRALVEAGERRVTEAYRLSLEATEAARRAAKERAQPVVPRLPTPGDRRNRPPVIIR